MQEYENPSVNKNFPEDSRRHVQDLQEILRGEISAVEAYSQVIKKVPTESEKTKLRGLLKSHEDAVRYWMEQIEENYVEPETTSGAWGTFVEAVVGTAKLFGNSAALAALKQGEEHGLNQYRKMIKRSTLTTDQREMILNKFIPEIERHLTSISEMRKAG